MRRDAWLIWLLLITLLAGTAVASSADFCTMSGSQPTPDAPSRDAHSLMGHGTADHSTANHSTADHSTAHNGTDPTVNQHGCCAGDSNDAGCMMNACLSMIPTIAYQASRTHAQSLITFLPAAPVPQPPLFPLLRPPIA